MMRTATISILIAVTLLTVVAIAEAQQPAKIPRIGILRIGAPPDPLIESFRSELNRLGYVDRQNIIIEARYSQDNQAQLRDLVADLVRQKFDVIIAPGGTAARAAKDATSTIPIVITAVADPVGEGLVSSLARPGGNITGLSNLSPDLSGKRLELLKEAFPKIARVAVLLTPSEEGGQLKAAEDSARTLKLQIQPFRVNARNDIDHAFKAMAKSRPDALLVFGSAVLFEHRKFLAEELARTRRPAMLPHIGFIEPGGLMSYGPNFSDLYRRAAFYVDRILKGTKPADLPVEQPMKFEFVINLKTATQIGVTIPPEVLARATRILR